MDVVFGALVWGWMREMGWEVVIGGGFRGLGRYARSWGRRSAAWLLY